MRIRAIYAADEAVQHAPAEERKALRDQHVRPLATSFFAWARSARDLMPGRNLATKALGYALNQEAELMRVLDDSRLPLDNTRSERALRKIVVGRKAWMFYGSDTHAEAAAALFSIIASCRLHRLDPFAYLDEVLRVLPYWPRERYLELAPKHWSATRARLRPEELEAPLSAFEIPPAEPALAAVPVWFLAPQQSCQPRGRSTQRLQSNEPLPSTPRHDHLGLATQHGRRTQVEAPIAAYPPSPAPYARTTRSSTALDGLAARDRWNTHSSRAEATRRYLCAVDCRS